MVDVEFLKEGMKGGSTPGGGECIRPRTPRRDVRKGETDARIRQILGEHPRGLTVDEVARALPMSRSAAGRRLEALARRAEIELYTFGQTRVFTLPRRVSLGSALARRVALVLVLSGDLRVLEVNDPLLSVFRLRREEIVGRPLRETPLAPHAGEGFLAALREGTGGRAGLSELDCLVGDVRYILRARITPLSSARGRRGVVVILEDITGMAHHRRQLEEVMDGETLGLLSSNPPLLEEILERRQEEERREIVEHSMDLAPVPALWIGRDGRFLRVNHAATLLLGYGEEELARLAFSDIDLDYPPGAWDSLWETLQAGHATRFERRMRTKAGITLRVEVSARHLTRRDREFVLLFVEDITRRKEEEEALRASEAAHRALLDTDPDPCLLVDARGRVLLANRAAALLGDGISPPAPGTPLFDAMPGEAAGVREAFGEVVKGRRSRILAWEISGRHLHTVLAPLLDASGEVDRVAIFSRDLTERKRVEDSLRYANEKLNLLTAVTRHDVLNDIAALGMYLELPEVALGPGSGMAGRLQLLVQSLRRKMEFTRDYADLGMKMPGWEDVAGCVERSVAALDTGSLRVDLDLPALEIYADPLFERVIANLVDNTFRHGEHATRIGFRARVEGDTCTLIVEDDGVGVPRGMKEPIFRPGYGRHTGFGLFLVREILGITGMSISETGEPGKGARFEIRIPGGGFRMKDGSGGTHGDARIQVQG